ncbi:hypothetical protein ACWGDX_01025 [Streptomyces sp. NPDC055025]
MPPWLRQFHGSPGQAVRELRSSLTDRAIPGLPARQSTTEQP